MKQALPFGFGATKDHGRFPVLAARKMERGPPVGPPRSFTRALFRAVFDSRSSLFAPKPQGKACYAG